MILIQNRESACFTIKNASNLPLYISGLLLEFVYAWSIWSSYSVLKRMPRALDLFFGDTREIPLPFVQPIERLSDNVVLVPIDRRTSYNFLYRGNGAEFASAIEIRLRVLVFTVLVVDIDACPRCTGEFAVSEVAYEALRILERCLS